MSNRYEQSLKEQAARIRRELAGERETKPVERPKKEEREDRFVLTDVPSPIYGFQRPKQSVPETVEAVEETKTIGQVLDTDEQGITDEVTLTDQEMIAPDVVLDEAEADAGIVPVTDVELLVPEPEVHQEYVSEEELPNLSEAEETDVAETASESVIETLLTSETVEESIVPAETSSELFTDDREIEEQLPENVTLIPDTPVAEAQAPVQSEVKKPVGPPVNVVMTTKDLMAMYRARREQNNLHGKK
ncbi:hypothetical protein ADM98_14245 [Exiguobacterium sp. BMC-KP]|uniref:hypothetical protein n=1 Tax=Exiguobacterium sp. BMC-KP TaxID=1684312 RepID=UPI0006AA17F6|nr:hypothetical protein [Exiguobacterium sp. BMC-KP]KOP29996.1 hypothetical protein ADM98_14245 [Exiguobacterium sp. BMC-KP]